MDAIRHALNVLSWQEMRDEDRPSRDIWMNNEALDSHFRAVKEKYALGGGGGVTPDEAPDLDQNELTRGLR